MIAYPVIETWRGESSKTYLATADDRERFLDRFGLVATMGPESEIVPDSEIVWTAEECGC